MNKNRYTAKCFCGQVELEVSGDPVFQGYCHCESCRSWLGAPIHAATLWPLDNVSVLNGEKLLATYKKTERSHRKHCTVCGGHVMNAHPGEGLIDIMASVLQDFTYQPTMHVHYEESTMSVRDGLPKYKDLPADFGGTGDLADEPL